LKLKLGKDLKMGISDKLKNIASNMQTTAKNTSVSVTQRILRLLSGFFIGLIFSLIVQELTQSADLMLVFLTVLSTAIIYKLLARLQIFQILIFDLICALIVALLRMYIMIAP
jgi:4-amino-4-deoxy-L-arabinose transferase-like glycosyltransferase